MLSRWKQLMTQLGFDEALFQYQALVAMYSQDGRYYHNCEHLSDCIDQLYVFKGQVGPEQNLLEVEIALWFHDAVYKAKSKANEEQSAELACQFLSNYSASPKLVQRVRELILATKNHSNWQNQFEFQLMLDIDLAILGAEEDRFWRYERAIRKEYGWVPTPIYCSKRKSLLQSFLAMPQLFRTSYFYDKYERIARKNICDAIRRM